VRKIKLIYIFFLVALPISTWAQLTVYPLEKNPGTQKKAAARMQAPVQVSLPFWDDFSSTTEDHAANSLWLNNNKVLVSRGQAINPPSINVASFDGLNEFGTPYNSTDNLDFGYRDTLESQLIKMTEVSLPFRNSVFLSFLYQAGGYGEPPDTQDFLRLEFKNVDEEWETIATLTVENAADPTLFYDTIFRINQDRFYHDGFQFRFISFGRKSGRYDSWHIDYVYLNKDRSATDNAYPDRSLSTPISTIFGKYYSIPINHFFNQPEINTTSFYIRNLFNIATVLNFNTSLTSKKNYAGTSVSNSVNLDIITPIDGIGQGGTIQAHELREVFLATLPDVNDVSLFDPAAKGIELTMTILLNSGDNKPLTDPESDYSIIYEPIDFRWNDTTRVQYFLDSAYTYDDGIAEYAAGLTEFGNQLAYQFAMKTSEQDTISALSVYFPYFAGVSASSVDFFIMDNENGKPANILYEQTVDVIRKANNEFTPIPLTEGVIVQDTFYIGYREPFSGRVRVGLDKSNNTGDLMYFRRTESSSWSSDWITGSLMIRPYFGKPKISVISGVEEENNPVAFYPNPNAGEFYAKGPVENLHFFTIAGHPVNFAVEDFGEEKRINLTAVPAGLYFVRYKSGTRIFTEKIIIR
jgi:hypothetical protein